MADPGWPTRGAGGAATWQEATRSRGPRGRPCGVPRGDEMAGEGPTGIVGPGESIGAVTQMRYRLTQFIDAIFLRFSRVGLCPVLFSGDVVAYRAFDAVRTVEIAWTQVHAIIKSNTC